jgi:phage N-6-adenine-methyltransferase
MELKTQKVLFSSKKDEWATPDDFVRKLEREHLEGIAKFSLDPCASKDNHKAPLYFTKEDDGLRLNWEGHTVFCNPPYSQIKKWVKKCYEESRKEGTQVCLLIPARTDTKFWHDYVMKAEVIYLVKGRIKFDDGKETKNSAPFPSAVVWFWNSGLPSNPQLNVMDNK